MRSRPALLSALHQLETEAAAAVEVRRPRSDYAAAPGILDFEPNHRARQQDADHHGVLAAGAAMEHAVGNQLGDQQLGALENAGRDAVARRSWGDDDPRGAGRARRRAGARRTPRPARPWLPPGGSRTARRSASAAVSAAALRRG